MERSTIFKNCKPSMGHLYHGYVSHNQSETIFFMGFPSWPRTIAWRICGSRHRTQPPWPKNPPLPWCCCWHPVIARRRCGRRWCRWSHWGVRVGGWLGYVKETSCVNRLGQLKASTLYSLLHFKILLIGTCAWGYSDWVCYHCLDQWL